MSIGKFAEIANDFRGMSIKGGKNFFSAVETNFLLGL